MLSSAPSSSSQNIPVSLFADPEFRRDLAADPIATLAAHGIKVRKSDLPAEIRLPNLDDLGRMSADSEESGNSAGNGSSSSNSSTFWWAIFLS